MKSITGWALAPRLVKSFVLSLMLLGLIGLGACGGDDKCSGGACQEPTACMTNDDCAAGLYCGGFECIPDPCTPELCERGSCARGSAICVNQEMCSEETESTDCLEGYECILGTCLNEASYCQSQCDRGVCDFAQRACVSAPNCAGDSNKCLQGEYCNAEDQCAPDLCEANEVECTNGGVCDPGTGECTDPEFCTSTAGCMEGNLCVFHVELSRGVCLPRAKACGSGPGNGGCQGNQVCSYDNQSLVAQCTEVGSCTTSLDCVGGRQCDGRVCKDAGTCQPDALEPNDDSSAATDFLAKARAGALRATMCQDDVDYFAIDVAALSEGETSGSLLVSLQYNRADVGLGKIEMQVRAPDGTSLATENSGSRGADGVINALVDLDEVAAGNYLVRVAGAGDLKRPGVRYTLNASFANRQTQSACMGATELVIGAAPQTGDTRRGASTALGSSCTGENNAAPEVVYRFELSEPSAVTITVTPTSNAGQDLSASVRSACSMASSEVACQPKVTDGLNPLSMLLEAGSYYVIVQDARGGQGGQFKISAGAGPAACTPATDHCVDENTASLCDELGRERQTVTCSAGCNPDTNACRRVPGDLCVEAVEVMQDFSATIAWAELQNDMQAARGECVPSDLTNNDTQTDGPEMFWKVTIPAQKVMEARMRLADSEQGVLYILDSCAAPATSCVEGANAGNVRDQRIGLANESDDPREVLLVADRSKYGRMTQATLDIEFLDIICNPAEAARCDENGNLEKCNKWGTRREVTLSCNFGCDAGACLPPTNETCAAPLPLENGVAVRANLRDYGSKYKPHSSCPNTIAGGREAVYMVTTTAPNTKVEVTMTADFDAVLYVSNSCASATGPQDCVGSSDAGYSAVERVNFEAPTPGSYFVFADAYSSSTSNGEFTVLAKLEEPSCTPGESLGCEGSSQLKYCDAKGFPAVQTCRDSCDSGACYNKPGEVCEDALPLASGQTVSGDLRDFYPDYFLPADSCTGKTTRGADVVYQIETTAPGQIIELELQAAFNASLYVSKDCVSTGEAPTCLAGSDQSTSGNEKITFLAADKGRYFVYVDTTSTATIADGAYTLQAEVRSPTCTPGEALGCNGDVLSYCNAIGEATDYACDGTCTGAACDTPTGDVCHDPIVLVHGEHVIDEVNAAGRTDSVSLSAGFNNQCLVGNSATRGRENIYRIDLLAGDLLTVDVQSQSSALVSYISTSCVVAAQTCEAIDSNGKNGKLEYFAPVNQSVFLVVDATNTVAASYTLDVDIQTGAACAPGSYRCLDADTLQVCSNDGTQVLGEFACANGCQAGACADVESPPTCADSPNLGGIQAPNVGAGISVRANYADLINHVAMPAKGCTRAAGPGPDLLYAVELEAGDVVEARVISAAGENPLVYVLGNCADANSCVAGGAPETGLNSAHEAYTRYMALGRETVYVVADSKNANASKPFQLDIRVFPGACNANETSCVDAQNEQFCDQGVYNERLCFYGACEGGATGGCTGAAPDVCALAQVVPNDGQEHTFYARLQDLGDSIDLKNAQYECKNRGPTPGPDAYYAIDLQAGDILSVTVQSPGDAVLWLASRCDASMVNSCYDVVNATSTGGKEILNFNVVRAGTYYVVVDHRTETVTEGEFSAHFKVTRGGCDFGETQCLDADTQLRCGPNGLWSETACYYGCDAGACLPARGKTCQDAIAVPDDYQPHTYKGLMQDYANQSSVSSSMCTGAPSGGTPGPEAYFKVNAKKDDIISMDWASSNDGVVWISSACPGVEQACKAALDGRGSSAPTNEKLTWVAPADGVYYVVGDNYTSSPSGEYEMKIHVQQPECSRSSFVPVCLDAATLQTCGPYGAYVEQSCMCDNGTCLEGGERCTDSPDVTQAARQSGGANFSGDWQRFENDYQDYCGRSTFDTDGQDLVYRVELEAGERVRVEMTSTGVTYPTVSFMHTCPSAGQPNVCLQTPAKGTTTLSTSYTAPSAQTVYILVDNDWPSGLNTFTVNIKID